MHLVSVSQPLGSAHLETHTHQNQMCRFAQGEAQIPQRGPASADTNYSLNIILQLTKYLQEFLKAQRADCQTIVHQLSCK